MRRFVFFAERDDSIVMFLCVFHIWLAGWLSCLVGMIRCHQRRPLEVVWNEFFLWKRLISCGGCHTMSNFGLDLPCPLRSVPFQDLQRLLGFLVSAPVAGFVALFEGYPPDNMDLARSKNLDFESNLAVTEGHFGPFMLHIDQLCGMQVHVTIRGAVSLVASNKINNEHTGKIGRLIYPHIISYLGSLPDQKMLYFRPLLSITLW